MRTLLAASLATGLLMLASISVWAGPPLPGDPIQQAGSARDGSSYGMSGDVPPDRAAKELAQAMAAQGDLSSSDVSLVGDQIDVAVTGSRETQPAVALCASDQYLVVYIRDYNVYGQRLTSGGDLLGSPFIIYNRSSTTYNAPATQPDVACEWSHNRFIVVWSVDYYNDGTDYDVYAQGVHGAHQTSGSQLHSGRLDVSEDASGVDEQDPAIACNSNAYTCLVAFEFSGTGSGDIYGQRIGVGSSGISLDGDRFGIGVYGVSEYNPDLAWGGYDNNYLVAWQYLHNTPSSHYRIVFNLTHDTEQHPTDDNAEKQAGDFFLIEAAYWTRHQTMPAVAYNRDEEEYLVAFQYDYNGDGSDLDIVSRRIQGGDAVAMGDAFNIASTGLIESSPALAFSGGPESFPGGMGSNQYLVTYISDEDASGYAVYGQAIQGAHDPAGQLEGDRQEIDRIPSIFLYYLDDPDVTGSINNGQYMSVWVYHIHGTSPNDDVLGHMLSPQGGVYVPLILSNYTQ